MPDNWKTYRIDYTVNGRSQSSTTRTPDAQTAKRVIKFLNKGARNIKVYELHAGERTFVSTK